MWASGAVVLGLTTVVAALGASADGTLPATAQAPALAQCQVRDVGFVCEGRTESGSICDDVSTGALAAATGRLGRLRDPNSLLPLSQFVACGHFAAGDAQAARSVLADAVARSRADFSRTERTSGALTWLLETAALQAAAGFNTDRDATMEVFTSASSQLADIDERWIAHVSGAQAFSDAGDGAAADRLLDGAATITRALPDAPASGPPRIVYLHSLVQFAAEAKRWRKAERLLAELAREPSPSPSDALTPMAIDGLRRQRAWLAEVIATRDLDIPPPERRE